MGSNANLVLALLLLAAGLVLWPGNGLLAATATGTAALARETSSSTGQLTGHFGREPTPMTAWCCTPSSELAGQSPDATIFMWNPPWTVLLIVPVLQLPFGAACLAWIGCNLALVAGIGLIVGDLAWLQARPIARHAGDRFGPPLLSCDGDHRAAGKSRWSWLWALHSSCDQRSRGTTRQQA